ncbi:hypothetical protein TKK_0014897 [Trichogramma kaykai]|uniref:TELO2-interacting protein 2 n=1 Tax=Trichogramma kaykai TaxID=54128 RepID=A0ABD2WCM9_9HYME
MMDRALTSRDDVEKVVVLVEKTLVPKHSQSIRPCAADDFKNYKETLKCNLELIKNLLEDKIIINSNIEKILIKIFIIVGEQSSLQLWNDEEHVQQAKVIENKLCEIFNCENVGIWLENEDNFNKISVELRPKLLKDTWKSYPGAVACYKWLLQTMSSSMTRSQLNSVTPILSFQLFSIIPTALIICDDYVEENKLTGLECLQMIINSSSKTRLLQKANLDKVIFDTLLNMTYKTEKKPLLPLYFCIAGLLDIFEYNDKFCESKKTFDWSERDTIIQVTINQMKLHFNVESCADYSECLTLLLNKFSSKWALHLIETFHQLCEITNYNATVIPLINVIKNYLLIYKPQDPQVYQILQTDLLKVKLMLDMQEQPFEEVESNLSIFESMHSLLEKLCPNLVKNLNKLI